MNLILSVVVSLHSILQFYTTILHVKEDEGNETNCK